MSHIVYTAHMKQTYMLLVQLDAQNVQLISMRMQLWKIFSLCNIRI